MLYKGTWLDGKKHGRGSQVWPDGSRYDGSWENGIRSGNGRMIEVVEITQQWTVGGRIYEGYWKDDLYNGQG